MDLFVRVYACCSLVLLVASACQAATGFDVANVHKDHPHKCWDEGLKKAFDIGEHWQTENCVSFECKRNKPGLYVEWRTCGKITMNDPACTLQGDPTLDYPFCCPQPVCRGAPQTNGRFEGLKDDVLLQ